MRAAFLLSAVLVPLALSCRTARLPAGTPFQPLVARTAQEAWTELARRAGAFQGARAYARATAVTEGRRQSFRLTLAVHADGSFDVDVLSPVGTRAAAFSVRDRELILRDSGRRRPIAELGTLTGIPLEDWDAREIAMILLGLPAHHDGITESSAADRLMVRAESAEYQIGAHGLIQVRSGQTLVSYDPAVFPPLRVRMQTASGQSFELEYLELLQMRI
jgi:hypothetical protein